MPQRHAFPPTTDSAGPAKTSRPQTHATATKRLTHIDTIRGLLLVLMALNHIPGNLHAVTDHPFGFMSAAEGFVFMAGLMAGYVYTRKWLRGTFAQLRQGCIGRAVTIYRWHVAIYLLVIAGLVAVGFKTGSLPANAPAALIEHPMLSVVTGVFLVQQPALFDILPMYCALLLATPWLLRAYSRTGYAHVLAGSLTLWALTNIFCPQVPFDNGLINTGAFNLATWQALYVGGLALGHRWAHRQQFAAGSGESASEPWLVASPSRPVLIGLIAAAALFFSVRHGFLPSGLSESALAAVTNKNNLAPLRLLDTALIIYLGYLLISRHARLFSWRPFAWIGQASLTVFSTHVLVAYAIHAFPEAFAETTAGRWYASALMLVALATAAAAHDLFSRKKSPAPAQKTSVATVQTRHNRTRRHMLGHEHRPPVPADSFHR